MSLETALVTSIAAVSNCPRVLLSPWASPSAGSEASVADGTSRSSGSAEGSEVSNSTWLAGCADVLGAFTFFAVLVEAYKDRTRKICSSLLGKFHQRVAVLWRTNLPYIIIFYSGQGSHGGGPGFESRHKQNFLLVASRRLNKVMYIRLHPEVGGPLILKI